MWERVTELLTRMGVHTRGATAKGRGTVEPQEDNPAIEFRPLNPRQAAALGVDTALVCPVTRQRLQKGALLYLCRDCNTTYSAEGWHFLEKTDRGRCCHCRHTGSVVPYHEGGTPL